MTLPRLLQAMGGAPHGGAEAHFVRLALGLHRAGVPQRIVMRPNAEREAKLRAGGIEPVTAPFGRLLDLVTRPRLRRAIRDFRPDVVLTHMSLATGTFPNGDFVRVARLGGYYSLRYYLGCDHLVGNTPDIVDYLVEEGWPRERAHYLPNLIDDRADAAPANRALYDTPANAPLVLALGRLHTNKAFDTLLDALAAAPDLWLWLAGEGPERRALQAKVAKLGLSQRVRFLGWVQDTAPYLAAADVVAVPSRHEPLGNVVIEGWMARTPVVAAASHGPAFLIRHGESGLLVPIDDAPALAAALRRAANDGALAARLAEGGRAAYERTHTEAAVVGAYMEFFDRVTHERRAAA